MGEGLKGRVGEGLKRRGKGQGRGSIPFDVLDGVAKVSCVIEFVFEELMLAYRQPNPFIVMAA